MKESSGREGESARRAAGRSFVRRLSLSKEKREGEQGKNGGRIVGTGFDSGNINHITSRR